jgi:hypothetical protein
MPSTLIFINNNICLQYFHIILIFSNTIVDTTIFSLEIHDNFTSTKFSHSTIMTYRIFHIFLDNFMFICLIPFYLSNEVLKMIIAAMCGYLPVPQKKTHHIPDFLRSCVAKKRRIVERSPPPSKQINPRFCELVWEKKRPRHLK